MDNNDRVYAFLLKEKINIDMNELAEFIEESHSGVEIETARNSYLCINTFGRDITNSLTDYIVSKLEEKDVNKDDVYDIVSNNLDMYLDIDNSGSDNIVIAEKVM